MKLPFIPQPKRPVFTGPSLADFQHARTRIKSLSYLLGAPPQEPGNVRFKYNLFGGARTSRSLPNFTIKSLP